MNKKICVIGAGRWGQNHIRTLFQMGNLAGIVESNPQRLEELLKEYPVHGFTDVEAAIKWEFDGYILATPAETHYAVGKKLLEQGLNVLIEKPMTLSSEHSKELVEIAAQTKARLMVGHLLLFHPAIKKIKEVIDSGRIGQLLYVYSTRLNLGTVRTEENVFWSFAPHDISILDYFIGHPATKIEAKGAKFLQDKIYDVTITQFAYPGNVHAHIFVSWLHPFKEQRLVVVGSQGMISFDDSSLEKNILYYNKHIDWEEGKPVKVELPDEIIDYEKGMPLAEELKYFVENLDKTIEVASGKTGHEVVKVLEKVQELISKDERNSGEVMADYFVHESSYVDEGVSIGSGTKIWHFSHVQKGSQIGEKCSLGQNVNVSNNVKIGNGVKLQNNVSVYEGVELEDYVFCGPSMVFTNDLTPRSKYPKGSAGYKKTLIKYGASIGANATIVCGHTVGRWAMIASGAVVTKDVPDYALMVGGPAKQIGWVCECGMPLKEGLKCKDCGNEYVLVDGKLEENVNHWINNNLVRTHFNRVGA